MSNEFRHRYVVSYTPRGVSKTGWHRLDVHVKRKGASVKARLDISRDHEQCARLWGLIVEQLSPVGEPRL